MTSQREILVLGDSNVKRFYSRIGLTQAQSLDFVQARNMVEAESALSSIKDSYKIVILAFLTNLVVDSGATAANDIDRMHWWGFQHYHPDDQASLWLQSF